MIAKGHFMTGILGVTKPIYWRYCGRCVKVCEMNMHLQEYLN